AKALEKLKQLEVNMIAPSHGIIFKTPERILRLYSRWVSGKLAHSVLIAYVSMWGSSEKMAKELEKKLREKGVVVSIYDLQRADLGEIARDLVDTACIVVSAPTFLQGVHPSGMLATYLVKGLKPPAKYAAVLSSYGWAPSAGKAVSEMLAGTGIELLGSVEAKARPKQADYEKIASLAETISAKLGALE
ncbi:MAG: flavodoxin domain-containing protein, partial [Candidatus Micrarchaeota archaeon]